VIEPALEKAEKRARGKRTPEVEALAAANVALQAEILLSDAGLSEEHRRELKPIAPLTIKPAIVVANLEEGTDIPEGLPEGTVGVYASIEAETAEMDPSEARALLDEFGAGYRAIDLITFLTTGDDETRAWEVRSGAKAPEAAGVIHTDLERGFIRAEVIPYDELVAAGSMDAAKQQGKVRVEGKDYEVREGDILHVRFAL
jgi:ribosome-binding ATPase